MDLRKPSELLDKKEVFTVFKSPEISSHITESYDKFRNNFDKVNDLSEQVYELSQQLSEKLSRSELENAMLSQLMILDENFKILQNQVKGLNKQDLKEFKETVHNLSENVNYFIETELPKYKKQVIKNELFVGEKVDELQKNVNANILNIREEIDKKFDNIAEVVDNNIEYFNQYLQNTSSQVKKTSDIYNNLSKILESKVAKESEKLEEYYKIIEGIQQTFNDLQTTLSEDIFQYKEIIEEKIEIISLDINSKIDSNISYIVEDIDSLKNKYDEIKQKSIDSEKDLKVVERYIQIHHKDIEVLKEEIFDEIEKLSSGNIQENIDRLEKKIDFIKETYSKIEPEVLIKEVIGEGLLNEPPSVKNSDPLTPLDQNFVTLQQLQDHYRLFINRIQQQLSTLGGGGETRFQYLDDIVGIATNVNAYNGKFLTYNSSIGKFEFTEVTSGTGGTDTRFNSVSEKSKLISGNTVNLVYNAGDGNVAICTNPTGPVILNVTGIPTDSSFDNRTITFTVIVTQGPVGYACTEVNLNGVLKPIKYPGAVVSVGSTNSYDIFNFTGINTVGSASSTNNYQVLGMVNGNFK